MSMAVDVTLADLPLLLLDASRGMNAPLHGLDQ